MIKECPNCSQTLRFSVEHKTKINNALDKLPQGRTLKFGCPKCKKPIELDKEGKVVGKELTNSAPQPIKTSSLHPHSPPNPPDISWLAKGESISTETVKNIPTAMILIPDQARQKMVVDAFKEKEYQIVIPDNVNRAINSMRFTDYSVVVYHSDYEEKPINDQDFHKFMKQMSMADRRNIYYILISADFKTLYDLEALTNSANMVINNSELKYISTLLTRGLTDHADLFEQYISILKAHGKN